MVHTPIDVTRVPTINQSPKEIAEMQEMIDAGILPKDFLKRHIDAVDANVFGVDTPRDREGWRVEQGMGSPGNMTQQSIDAYVKYQSEVRKGGPEPGYEQSLKRMIAELAECEKKKAANPTGGFHYGRT
jgi:hypothetical protein